jgi:hypothetical protein
VHALQHLRGNDRRLLQILADADNPLLLHGHAGHIDFDAQIAASDHHAISLGDDLLKPVEGVAVWILALLVASPPTGFWPSVHEHLQATGRNSG